MKKYIKSALSVLIILTICTLEVGAENVDNSETEFVEVVESTEIYSEYFSEIVNIFVNTNAVTEDGLRYTLSYNLTSNAEGQSRNLVFVADEDYNIIVATEISIMNDLISVNNIIDNVSYSYRSWIDPNCSTFICTKKEQHIWSPQPGCGSVVGKACVGLSLLPGYGLFLSLLCQGGVIVTCNLDFSYKCVDGFWDNVCLM